MTVDYTRTPQAPGTPGPQGGWWSRNWKWVVPIGCGSIVVIIVAFVATILAVAFTAMRSTDAYKDAVATAQHDPRVIAALGTPIETGFIAGGNVNVNGDSGTAQLDIPISGPKGKGKIHAVADKSSGKWTYSVLRV